MLECYKNILILTSNRIGTFDEAFESQIQLALHYPMLDLRSRQSRRTDFFENNKAGVDFGKLRTHLDHVTDFEMNGRQIMYLRLLGSLPRTEKKH